jgi:lipopolysaccharide transport system ATP-binding protein
LPTSSDNSPALIVEGLGKEYQLGAMTPIFGALRSRFGARGRTRDRVWALRDVSFAVERGEAIGVIGHNGAGKTTLLKILSRITEPTTGSARVQGRVGSLLEVGTGFHPELTGRENIFLNGAILGMRRKEIVHKFDDIVAFAEVEQFVDTPVKRYSSGMYVRLAFAVAAHLDTDMLLVDEVLSVGDFAFQRRCLGVMHDQASSLGRTVLFVSHNLGAVKLLTTQCLWLDHGQVRAFGPTEEVLRTYVTSYREEVGLGTADISDLVTGRPVKADPLSQEITFERVELLDDGVVTSVAREGDPLELGVYVKIRKQQQSKLLELSGRVLTADGIHVYTSYSAQLRCDMAPGVYRVAVDLSPNMLSAGSYVIELAAQTVSDITSSRSQDIVRPALTFDIEENPESNMTGYTGDQRTGVVRVSYRWSELQSVGSTDSAASLLG